MGCRPEMIRTKTITMAMTSRTWMNPCIVAPVTNPSNHRISNTMAIVYNIIYLSLADGRAFRTRPPETNDYLSANGTAMVMLLTTLVTPVMSVASLVTRLFSASFLAMPLKVTTPAVVETPVCNALVE